MKQHPEYPDLLPEIITISARSFWKRLSIAWCILWTGEYTCLEAFEVPLTDKDREVPRRDV